MPLLTAALISLGFISAASAGIQSAGDLLVNIDATGLMEGPLATIDNAGTLGGVFEARGGDGTIPNVAVEGGTKGIRFDGTDFMQLVDAAGGNLIPPPEGLVGIDPTRSIEVWVLNPSVDNEETMVSWGKRGGPDGTNVSFGYGSDFRWGAMGHWGGEASGGGPDLGWNNNGGNPVANRWHHLVYTYDGTTTRVYVDGAYANGEYLGAGRINTHSGTSINLAAQLEGNGTTVTGGLRGSLTLAKVRIHDEVLSLEQIKNNYDTEKAAFIDPVTPPPIALSPERLSVGPAHRYSFNDAPLQDATGAEIIDSVGGANGQVLGLGAEYTGSRLRLAGGGSSTAAYGDLPNGLLSGNGVLNGGTGEFTIEGWFHHNGSQTWSRIFDIGSTSGGEVTGPGAGGTGLDYLEYSLQIGDDVNSRRLELRNEDPAGGGVTTFDHGTATFGTDVHFAVTWNEATGDISAYENGKRVGGMHVDDAMSDINDVNVWLGRSNWSGDRNSQAEFDEVRFYPHVLSPGEVLGSYMAGPENLNNTDIAVALLSEPSDRISEESGPVSFKVTVAGSTPIWFQWLRNGAPINGETNASLAFTAVAGDNGAKYSCVVSNTVGAAVASVTSKAATLTVKNDTVTLKHRYSFNEPAGSVEVQDTEGGAPALLVKGASIQESGSAVLDGVDGYVDLPNGVLSSLGNATIETWATYNGGNAWSRLFDLGVSVGGEDVQGAGQDYLLFTPKTPAGFPRFYANQPNGGDTAVISLPGYFPVGKEVHVVVTYSYTANVTRIYMDGVLLATGPAGFPLSSLNDVNNWLGRSQYNDPYFKGSYNEFRLYDGAMTASQVAASFAAGPDAALGRPSLRIVSGGAGALTLRWPAAAVGYKLESSALIGPGANWAPVVGAATPNGADLTFSVNSASAARYYRLSK